MYRLRSCCLLYIRRETIIISFRSFLGTFFHVSAATKNEKRVPIAVAFFTHSPHSSKWIKSSVMMGKNVRTFSPAGKCTIMLLVSLCTPFFLYYIQSVHLTIEHTDTDLMKSKDVCVQQHNNNNKGVCVYLISIKRIVVGLNDGAIFAVVVWWC